MKTTLLIIAAFIIWISTLWTAVLSVLSIVGGWRKLSILYPLKFRDRDSSPLRLPMSRIKMGFINYNSCVNILFTETGIILEIMKIFSFMHKPVFIPFDKITDAARKQFLSSYTEFTVEKIKIAVFGKAGEELFSKLNHASKNIHTGALN